MSVYVAPIRRNLALVPAGPAGMQKAGPLGPGAGVLQTEFPLDLLLGRYASNPAKKMQKAWQLGIAVPWIRAAERVIAGSCSTVEWHLEDDDDTEIDDEYNDVLAQAARSLLEKPQQYVDTGAKLTRRELWALTFRHMGLCGNAFWYMDQMNVYRLPRALLYIRPDRMTPNEDEKGNLTSWQLDKTDTSPGLKIEINEVIHFKLDPPDTGHYGIGLVESALLKAQNSQGIDSHLAHVLAAGGRLSGLLMPKEGALNPGQVQQLIADARTVVEQPDAAKRMQILAMPVDFIKTTMTIEDLDLINAMTNARDDLLALWGVPLSQIGGATPSGLNSGDTRKYDRQALWENANHPRLVSFTESTQFQLLDRWTQAGSVVELEIVEPSFADEGPRYDLLAKSAATPLRNWERREIIGKEPFGPSVLNEEGLPVDDEVWLPANSVRAFTAPEEGTQSSVTVNVTAQQEQAQPVEATAEGSEAVSSSAGETSEGKARLDGLQRSLVSLRKNLDARYTPRVKDAVAKVLDDQRREIIDRAKGRIEHLLLHKGQEVRTLWDDAKWDRKMRESLQGHLVGVAETMDAHVRTTLDLEPAKAGPVGAVQHTLNRGGTRITALNARTRDAVLSVIRKSVAESIDLGLSPAAAGDALEEAVNSAVLQNGQPVWDEYRAEMVARTEMTSAYNDATLGSYSDLGVTRVQAIDGDKDEECAARNGQIFDIDEAEDIEDHPNGTLDWVPVLD